MLSVVPDATTTRSISRHSSGSSSSSRATAASVMVRVFSDGAHQRRVLTPLCAASSSKLLVGWNWQRAANISFETSSLG